MTDAAELPDLATDAGRAVVQDLLMDLGWPRIEIALGPVLEQLPGHARRALARRYAGEAIDRIAALDLDVARALREGLLPDGTWSAEDAREALRVEANHPEPAVRRAARAVIAATAEPRPQITEAAEAAVAVVLALDGLEAAEVVRTTQLQRAVRGVIAGVEDDGRHVEIEQSLLERLEDEDWRTRAAAVQRLAWLGTPAAITAIAGVVEAVGPDGRSAHRPPREGLGAIVALVDLAEHDPGARERVLSYLLSLPADCRAAMVIVSRAGSRTRAALASCGERGLALLRLAPRHEAPREWNYWQDYEAGSGQGPSPETIRMRKANAARNEALARRVRVGVAGLFAAGTIGVVCVVIASLPPIYQALKDGDRRGFGQRMSDEADTVAASAADTRLQRALVTSSDRTLTADDVAVLRAALDTEEGPVRRRVIAALAGASGEDTARRAAIAHALDDRDVTVRHAAARVLVRDAPAAVERMLIRDLRSGQSATRGTAIAIAARLAAITPALVEALVVAAGDADPSVGAGASALIWRRTRSPGRERALAAHPNSSARGLLGECGRGLASEQIKAIVRALVRLGPSALPALVEALEHPDGRVQSVAEDVLVRQGARAVDGLVERLDAPGVRPVLEAIRSAIDDPDVTARIDAALR